MNTRNVEPPKPLKFSGKTVTLIDITEANGFVLKIQLWCEDGPLASALASPSPKTSLHIKDYSENEGLLDALEDAEVVSVDIDTDAIELLI